MGTSHVALVTGGGGGIGRAVCRALAGAGARVVVGGRHQETCEVVAREIRETGGEALSVELDVSKEESVVAAEARVREEFGAVDWLVNNAGVAVSAPLLGDGKEGDLFTFHMDVNFHGARRVFEVVLPTMIDRRYGRVVQVASSAGLVGYAYVAAYTASKHALLGYTRSAALELLKKGVALNAVCPYYVDSPMTDRNARRLSEKTGRTEEEMRTFFSSQNPGGVLVTVEEVARTTLDFLESDTTGAVVELIGGGQRAVEEGQPLKDPRS